MSGRAVIACSVGAAAALLQARGTPGAVSSGSTKGVEAPTIGAQSSFSNPRKMQTRAQPTRLCNADAAQLIGVLIARLAPEIFPGEIAETEGQRVVIDTSIRRPR